MINGFSVRMAGFSTGIVITQRNITLKKFIMKAISLLQPWASLVVMGVKQFETRSWNTNYRGRILIHASKAKNKEAMRLCSEEPFYSVIGGLYGFYKLPFGAIIGEVTVEDTFSTISVESQIRKTNEWYYGDYSPGRYAWKLTSPIKFELPIPAKGSLSIWEYIQENLLLNQR